MTARVYEVVVRGRIGPELMVSLKDFQIDTDPAGLTRLIGNLRDQSQLLGLLTAFNDLHIEVVSVNYAPS